MVVCAAISVYKELSMRGGSCPMSRFINLEFGGETEDQSQGETPGLARDEHYYLHEAQAAFERAEFEKALRHYAKVLEFNPQNDTKMPTPGPTRPWKPFPASRSCWPPKPLPWPGTAT